MKLCALCGAVAANEDPTCASCGHADWFDVPEPKLEIVPPAKKLPEPPPAFVPAPLKPSKTDSTPTLNFQF